MASRPIIAPFPVITNGDMSGNLTSLVTIIQVQSVFSYGVSWAGTAPVGTISVQGSNDYSVNPGGTVLNPGTWNALPLQTTNGTYVTAVPVSGNTGSGIVDVGRTGIFAIRLIYTFTSGVGSLQALVVGKAD